MSILSPKNFRFSTVAIFLLPNDTFMLSSVSVLVENGKALKSFIYKKIYMAEALHIFCYTKFFYFMFMQII